MADTPNDSLDIQEAARLGSATLHEAAGRIGALPAALQAAERTMHLAGPAFPVLTPSGDNLWLHRAIYVANPGDILIVATGDESPEWGYWGEILSEAAVYRNLGGLVLEGGSRDTSALTAVGFPVFSLGRCIRGTIKDMDRDYGRLGDPVEIGGVVIERGDLIVGDADGVVALPAALASTSISLGREREAKECDIIRKLRSGSSTLDLYHL